MFEIDRTFSSRNLDTGLMDWFFNAREGVYGPYNSQEQATEELNKLIQYCKEAGDDGGRSKPESHRLSILPKVYHDVMKQ